MGWKWFIYFIPPIITHLWANVILFNNCYRYQNRILWWWSIKVVWRYLGAETYIHGIAFWLYSFAYILTGLAVSRFYMPIFFRLNLTSANEVRQDFMMRKCMHYSDFLWFVFFSFEGRLVLWHRKRPPSLLASHPKCWRMAFAYCDDDYLIKESFALITETMITLTMITQARIKKATLIVIAKTMITLAVRADLTNTLMV